MRTTISAVVLALLLGCGGNPNAPSQNTANFGGNWRGNYTVTGCNQSGGVSLANICGSLGNQAPYTISLTQTGANATGSFMLGSINFPNTGGTVSGNSLSLQGTSISQGITVVANWALTMTGQQLGGTITHRWSSATLSGEATVVGTISSAAR